ncbi:MAG: hypothetical protein KZQ80_07115 [Candidatus Thiodiazotropha sp. (ex Monitilora ramsayi)]|nr:hypothetical protein [Candidatus Thiodiazotropha sp. (ex Monitilora ramsayi)]
MIVTVRQDSLTQRSFIYMEISMNLLLKRIGMTALVPIVSSMGIVQAEARDISTASTTKVVKAQSDFPEALPIYKVTEHGISKDQVEALAKALNIKALELDQYGAVHFSDINTFLSLPMKAEAPEYPRDSEDEGGIIYEGFDYQAIEKIKVLDVKSATAKFSGALSETRLLPSGAVPLTSHSRFEAVSSKGKVIADQPIDTAVSLQFRLNDVSLEGPGANIRAAFGGDGNVTQLSYAFRSLKEAGKVLVVDENEARNRCATWTTTFNKALARDITPSLAYFAPPMSERIEILAPSIRCEAVDAEGVASQIYFVPAAVDAKPTQIEPTEQKYRSKLFGMLDFDINLGIIRDAHAAFNRRDVGSEGTGPCSGLPHTATNIASFNDRMILDGVAVQFSWLDANAWEQDWKDPSFSGDDQDWVDDVDMAYWQGHGSPGGFSFSGCSSNDDTFLSNSDALWGNRNVEWISLFTCLVLASESGGDRWWERWGSAFDRLHQINSFDTVSYHSSQHGGIFANYMLRNNPMTVRQAWAQASIDDQPAQVIWATMGVISNGNLSNYNDHYWGKGSVGPDIPASQVGGYWRLSGGS